MGRYELYYVVEFSASTIDGLAIIDRFTNLSVGLDER